VRTDIFHLAVERARRPFSDAEWINLSLTDQANAICTELRRLDSEETERRARDGLLPDGTWPNSDALW